MADESSTPLEHRRKGSWVVPGMLVVAAMFTFAVTVTGLLYLYWDVHTAPFRPLQEALAAEFEESHPLVQGGQRKMNKGTPRILRIILRIDFDPEDKKNDAHVEEVVDRIVQLAEEHHGLAGYDTLEVHLVRLRAEQEAQTLEILRDVTASRSEPH